MNNNVLQDARACQRLLRVHRHDHNPKHEHNHNQNPNHSDDSKHDQSTAWPTSCAS